MIYATSLNELTYFTCQETLSQGKEVESRNGKAIELIDTTRVLTNPKNRHLYLHGRTNNIYGTLGEVFWVLGGRTSSIYPVLNFFVPRAKDYSDDGKNWRGAYGPRLCIGNQIDGVVNTFLQDGKNSRRAVIAIYQPALDSFDSIAEQGLGKSKDVPCSNFMWFWIRDNKLHCKLSMRSNDVIFGFSNINVVEFTILQEIILRKLQEHEGFQDVELGEYRHNAVNLHVYDSTIKQAEDILSNTKLNLELFKPKENWDIKLAKGIPDELFNIYTSLMMEINSSAPDLRIKFKAMGTPTEQNQLFSYALLCQNYIRFKHNKEVDLVELNEHLCDDLKTAVLHNKFTPDAWRERLA